MNKSKTAEREKDERKRSLSVSSSGYPDSGGESDSRDKEKDKKVRKNSVFGNLFKKKTKKSSKDEDAVREEGSLEVQINPTSEPLRQASAKEIDSLRNDWANPIQLETDQVMNSGNERPGLGANDERSENALKHTTTDVSNWKDLVTFTSEYR
jgi:hypothetical protein